MKKYDTIIFDLDGTLLNTLEDLTDSVNYALELYGYPKRSIEEVREFLGNGVARLIALAVPGGVDDPHYKDCLEANKKYYLENMSNKTVPYKGIINLLQQLKKENYKLAVVSNKIDKAVKGLVRKFFGEYVQVAIGDTDNISKKPAPDTVLKALKELNSSPDKAVYVGDSEVDVKTAKNSGIMCVGVTWGFRDRDVLEKEGADFIIEEPMELMKIIDSM
ncbi:MAG: HAD family hydrolase [Clostridiaceae bacterium]|nr:HAD family hydrolase [Clostridiaceae bacterium]